MNAIHLRNMAFGTLILFEQCWVSTFPLPIKRLATIATSGVGLDDRANVARWWTQGQSVKLNGKIFPDAERDSS